MLFTGGVYGIVLAQMISIRRGDMRCFYIIILSEALALLCRLQRFLLKEPEKF